MTFFKLKKTFRGFIFILIVLILINVGYYFKTLHKINQASHYLYTTEDEIGLRKFPYPFKAALAICNDIDSTSTVEEFLKIQEFLNTKNITEMGRGVGLEIGTSIFMFDSTNQANFSYFSCTPLERTIIQKFIAAGYIDCLHSWGEGYKNKSDAVTAIKELDDYHYQIKVWVNHSSTRSNLGNWRATNYGDNTGSIYYHSDLTISYGIRFVWLGSSTYIIGQSVPFHLNTFLGSCDSQYFVKSIKNVVRALVKHLLAIYGLCHTKYSLHESNDLVSMVELDDGQKVYQFIRYDNHPDGIGLGANSRGVAYNISTRVLNQLKKVQGYAILYTHFGKNADSSQVIAKETQEALRYLENQYRSGEIYVTTTSKLLNYYLIHNYLHWSSETNDTQATVRIHSVADPIFGAFIPTVLDLQGLTFYVPSGKSVQIFIGEVEIKNIVRNPPDETNRESITIPLSFLTYPELDKLK